MRHHIRREAGRFSQAAWWLAPVVFAIAALAAAALGASDEAVAPVPAAVAAPAAPARAILPALAPDAVEVTEHVQAF
jgi:hypothetical protein